MKNLFKKSQAIKDRDRTKQSFIYYFIILSGLFMFVYGAISLFLALPFVFTLAPVAIVALFVFYIFIKKNWKLIWLYVSDMERGKLMLYLNNQTHFEYEHKLKLVKWVYPSIKEVRIEKWAKIANKIFNGGKLNDAEKKLYSRKRVSLPQQLIDGFNEAMTVDALIYAHRNIQVLSEEVRDKFELTDENISKFNLQNEVSKCK